MLTTPHPSTFVPEEILSEIRSHAAAAEEMKTLHPGQLNVIYDQRWFRMFVPKSEGGLQKTLTEGLKIEEALAWADGSTAWVVTLCSGAGWFYGFLAPELSQSIFADDRVCIAGSGAASGTAAIEGKGFRINGTWKYASGALHATMFTANCTITKDGKSVLNEDGTPVVKAVILERQHVVLKKNWDSMGMIATGSHGFSVSDVFVDPMLTFQITPENATHPASIYRYPFLTFAEATLVVNYTGMTQQFLDLCDPVFRKRTANNPDIANRLTQVFSEAKEKLQECRNRFYQVVDLSWTACDTNGINQEQLYENVSKTSHELYRVCLSIMSTLYPHTGLTGASQNNELNRIWRNFHTASQHTLFSLR